MNVISLPPTFFQTTVSPKARRDGVLSLHVSLLPANILFQLQVLLQEKVKAAFTSKYTPKTLIWTIAFQ